MNNKAHLRPQDFDSNGDIIPMACKEEKGDLISRKWLTYAIRNRRTYLSYEDAKDVIDLINNAPTVEAFTENDKALAYCEGYVRGSHEAYIRPQGDIRWTDKLAVTSSGDIIDFEGRVVGHINLEEMKGGAENE